MVQVGNRICVNYVTSAENCVSDSCTYSSIAGNIVLMLDFNPESDII